MRLFQNESSCKTFRKENMFDLHEKEPVVGTHFHMNGFAGRLVFYRESQLRNGLFTTLLRITLVSQTAWILS